MPIVKGIKHPYIIKKKGVQGGRAVITGTRIPVSAIIIWYKAGKEIYEILDMFFNRQVLVICQDWLASTMR